MGGDLTGVMSYNYISYHNNLKGSQMTNLITKSQKSNLDKLPTTSAKIRFLDKAGLSRSEITKVLKYKDGRDLRYQHVRNVLVG